jgi:hypothetical protein
VLIPIDPGRSDDHRNMFVSAVKICVQFDEV